MGHLSKLIMSCVCVVCVCCVAVLCCVAGNRPKQACTNVPHDPWKSGRQGKKEDFQPHTDKH